MEAIQNQLKDRSLRVATFGIFVTNLALFVETSETLRRYYARRTMANAWSQNTQRRQRASDLILEFLSPAVDKVNPAHDTAQDVIAFGRNYFGRRCMPGDKNGAPVCKSIRRRLAATRRVVLIDEYFTSQKCYKCHAQLDMDDKTRVGTCTGAGCDNKCDRDVNAAKNIRAVFDARVSGWRRPPYLCRPKGEEAA